MTTKKKVLVYIVTVSSILLLLLFAFTYKKQLSTLLQPFFIALIIAYLVNPLVNKLETKKVSRMVGILIIYISFTLLTVAIVIFLVPEVANNTEELMKTVPDITKKYQNMFNGMMSFIQSSNWPPEIKNAIFKEVQNGTVIAQEFAMNALKRSLSMIIEMVSMLLDFILAMIIAYYFIKDTGFFKKATLSLTPRRWRNGIIGTGREINLILTNFIRGQLITAIIVGVMEMIGLSLTGVKYPLVLGLVGGIANVIPYFGPFIGAIPAVAVALIQSPMTALWTIVVFTIVQQIDNAFISPKIIEGRLGLHPVTTILAVLVGGEFFGIIGMLVSVPLVAIGKAIIKRVVEAIV